MDGYNESLADFLIRSLSEEFQSWYSYFIVYKFLKCNNEKLAFPENPESIKGAFREHADDEYKHANLLLNRLYEIGGKPCKIAVDYSEWHRYASCAYVFPNSYYVTPNVISEIRAEQAAVNTYAELASFASDNNDEKTFKLAELILKDEQDHLVDLQIMYNKVNNTNYSVDELNKMYPFSSDKESVSFTDSVKKLVKFKLCKVSDAVSDKDDEYFVLKDLYKDLLTSLHEPLNKEYSVMEGDKELGFKIMNFSKNRDQFLNLINKAKSLGLSILKPSGYDEVFIYRPNVKSFLDDFSKKVKAYSDKGKKNLSAHLNKDYIDRFKKYASKIGYSKYFDNISKLL